MLEAGGIFIRRVTETAFPGKYTQKGTQRYIAVPIIAEERMGLENGDFLDVIIRWPKTEEYEIGDKMKASDDADESGKGRKKKKE